MFDRQTKKFAAAVVDALPEAEENIMQGWIQNPKALQKVLEEALCPPKPVELLLEPLGTITIPATTGKFVATDKFRLKKVGGICSYLGDNFTSWFLSGKGKIEDPMTEQTLRYAKLRQSSVDSPIIAELDGEAKAEITLTEMFSLMEKQKNGESGVLLNNGYANIFYIRDQNLVLRTVRVRWGDDGWYVDAHSVENPYGWDDGRQVFSRNS